MTWWRNMPDADSPEALGKVFEMAGAITGMLELAEREMWLQWLDRVQRRERVQIITEIDGIEPIALVEVETHRRVRRRCRSCGGFGHNARTCAVAKPAITAPVSENLHIEE